jgi:HAD superfamily hydrolase (TIGR01484 family)
MRPRLIATDLDGTLLDHEQHISPRTVDAVKAAMAAGIEIVLVTARAARTVAAFAEQLGGGISALCGNGTILAEFAASPNPNESEPGASGGPDDSSGVHTWKTTLIRGFEAADAVAIVDQLRPAVPEAGFAMETGFEIYFEPAFHAGTVQDARRILTDSLTSIAPQMPSIVKVLSRSPQRTADEMLQIALRTVTVDAEISHSGGRGLVEIGPKGATKANALAWLCERRGIAADEVAAFGDMPNDLDMLRWAGIGHAMANAHPDVIAAADRVIGHHAEDGVALAIESLLA